MRRYETIFIVDPDLSDEERTPLFERLTPLFPQLGGLLVEIDEWGAQKLAYEIKKKARGYYVRLDYCGTGPLVDEIERFFRIDDRVLKFMTIIADEEVDMERLKEEMAAAEAEKAKLQAEQTEEPAAEEKVSDDQQPDAVADEAADAQSEKEE